MTQITDRPATTDHLAALGKVARRTHTTIYTDEAPLDAHDAAVAALDLLVRDLSASSERRQAAARAAAVVAGGDATAERRAADAVAAADTAAIDAAKAQVADAEQAVAAAAVAFTFRSLGRRRWRQIVAEHPPTDVDRADWKREGLEGEPAYAFEAVLAALLTEALVSPALSPAQVAEVLDGQDWNDAEIGRLWLAAMEAQTQARTNR